MGWPPSPQAALRRLVRRLPLQPAQLRVMNELSPGGTSRLRSPRAGHPQRTPKDSLFSIYGLVRIEYFQ